ncbi:MULTISPECIES: exo-alpha-sialidase [Acidobacterium]|nr:MULTISPECIES: exo-alpha-sialidase [Acidobacterium]HCT59261.1 hypothetical protein [Acidobacterium sp.]
MSLRTSRGPGVSGMSLLLCLIVFGSLAARATAVPARTHSSRKASSFTLRWGNTARRGPYPVAQGIRSVQVDGPDGHTPSLDDLESLQYHHHTRVAIAGNGRIWVAYSGAMRREGESGMITEVKSSRDGLHWSAPTVVVAPPSPFDGKLNAGRRISYPRALVRWHHRLYLVAAIDQANGYGCCTNEQGEALVAARLYASGRVGTPFRVSRAPYLPLRGSPGYRYHRLAGPALFEAADSFGTWGGSAPGQPPSAWTGYGIAADGTTMVEPNAIRLSRHPDLLFRLWRDEGRDASDPARSGEYRLYRSVSRDEGRSWSPAIPTDIPNSPSETTLLRLHDGQIAVIGNALDRPEAADARDPLYLALFDGATGKLRSVHAVRQNLGSVPFADGNVCGPQGKPCGASYPGAAEYHGHIYVSYSIDKQQIWLSIVPESALGHEGTGERR